jgi:hypothetical protein
MSVHADPTERDDSKIDVAAVRSHDMEDSLRNVRAASPAVTPAKA